jgi:hypothetical protein
VCIFNYISKIAKLSGGKKNLGKKFQGGIVTTCVGALAAADAVLVFFSMFTFLGFYFFY